MTPRVRESTATDLPRYCGRCSYDLRGTPLGHKCPECGALPHFSIPDRLLREKWRAVSYVAVLSLLCTTIVALAFITEYLGHTARLSPQVGDWARWLCWRLDDKALPMAFFSNVVALSYLAVRLSTRNLRMPAFAGRWRFALLVCCFGIATMIAVWVIPAFL